MARIRTPRSRDQAVALLETYGKLAGEIAVIEENREKALSATNAVADAMALKVVEQQVAIVAALEQWWPTARDDLTGGKRKSIELAGCVIGTKLSRASLEHKFDDDAAAVAALRAAKWAKPYVRVTYSVDRTETLKALDPKTNGRHAAQLAELGFKRVAGEDRFFLERVGQAGTVSG